MQYSLNMNLSKEEIKMWTAAILSISNFLLNFPIDPMFVAVSAPVFLPFHVCVHVYKCTCETPAEKWQG